MIVSMAGLIVGAAAALEAAWTRTLQQTSGRAYFILFGSVIVVWLAAMFYGCYVWNLAMPFYRPLGIVMSIAVILVLFLAWSALETRNSRRALVALVVVAVGLKVVHWAYYVPEWNYRYSQGPWARAIAQWVPKNWTVYTFHDWPPDLAFLLKRPVRQLRSPLFLDYQSGPESKFVLLQAAEFENWPESAQPITPVARFLDQSAAERVLARTAGPLPPPLGPNPTRFTFGGRNGITPGDAQIRR
jgi:hypothetical protein